MSLYDEILAIRGDTEENHDKYFLGLCDAKQEAAALATKADAEIARLTRENAVLCDGFGRGRASRNAEIAAIHADAHDSNIDLRAEIARLKQQLADTREACARKCEQRADCLTEGSAIARLCARDIRNGDDLTAGEIARLTGKNAVLRDLLLENAQQQCISLAFDSGTDLTLYRLVTLRQTRTSVTFVSQ